MTKMLSDAEREAIIRERLRLHPRPRCQCDACVLSRRLDEARTSAAPPAESLSQRKCFHCGCTVDQDDLCCDAPFEDDE